MKRLGIFASSLVLLATIVATPLQANAASNALGVNPRRDYTVAPGGKISDTLFVNNTNKTEVLDVSAEVIDFRPQNQTGTPSLLLKEKEPTRWSLKPYVSITDKLTIPAGQSREVPFTVTIPASVGAGSYYSAIRFSAVNNATGQNVSLTGSAVTLMFVRVSGEAKSNMTLKEFGAFTPNAEFTDGVYATFYGATKPKYLSYLLQNNGNLAEQPAGSILIKDMFGKEYKLIEDANPSKNLILIGQTRRIDVCLNEERKQVKNPETGAEEPKVECNAPKMNPGRYTATLNLVYGDAGNTQGEIKEVATFWYLPAWFIISVVLVIGLIAFGIWFLIRKIKNRGAHKFRGR